jgi:diacylglycerol kinase (ATP)
VPALERLLDGDGMVARPETRADLEHTAEEFRAAAIETLAINGGDGTLHVVLSAFARAYGTAPLPSVLPLRGGTMNTIADALGIRESNGDPLRRLLEKRRRGLPARCEERELLAVGDHLAFLFGTGAIAGYLRLYYETGQPGTWSAAQVLGKGVASSLAGGAYGEALVNRWRGRVVADGREWRERDYLAVSAACIDRIGLGFRPWPRATTRRGHFQALGIHCSAAGFIADLPRIWRGLPLRDGKAIDVMAEKLELFPDGPFDYVLDGDLYEAEGPVTVEAGPRVRFVVG